MGVLAHLPEGQPPAGVVAVEEWAQITASAPQLAATMSRYLVQAGTFLAPRSVDAADIALRQLTRWLLTHTDVNAVADIKRNDIEDFKVWLADQPASVSADDRRPLRRIPHPWHAYRPAHRRRP